jgi:DNA-directed RNA polymerase specialized sigma24 family protein
VGNVKMLVTEPFVLDFLTATMSGRSAEKQVYDAIRLREALDAMPQDARELWEQRLFGYTFEEISEETHESADTLNTRARRGVKEAMNRLFGHGKR